MKKTFDISSCLLPKGLAICSGSYEENTTDILSSSTALTTASTNTTTSSNTQGM